MGGLVSLLAVISGERRGEGRGEACEGFGEGVTCGGELDW